MLRPEPTDIILILLAALVLFGPKRIPEIARAMGSSIREFRDAVKGEEKKKSDTHSHEDSGKT